MKIDAPLAFPEQMGPQKLGTSGSPSTQNNAESVDLSPDQVQISGDSGKTEQLKANLSGVPDVRQDRVAALKQAIGEGSYNVSSEQIAQAMSDDLFGHTE